MKTIKNMGEIQRAVLLIGLTKIPHKPKYDQFDRLCRRVDVTPREVKINYYGFPVAYPWRRSCVFNTNEIGFPRYRSAGVCIVQAFQSLIKRGLAKEVRCCGIKLTGKGVNVAKLLR